MVRSPLREACENQWKVPGLMLEFGVFSGKTINLMAQFHQGEVFGFDTFEGLPEDWNDKFKKGHFDCHGKLPKVLKNVKLVKGLFQDTLEPFLKGHPGNISVCHLDADLYSATRYVLETLAPRIVPGSILVFDELINYNGYEEHEWKALIECCLLFGWKFEWIAQSGALEEPLVVEIWETQQVAIRIIAISKPVK